MLSVSEGSDPVVDEVSVGAGRRSREGVLFCLKVGSFESRLGSIFFSGKVNEFFMDFLWIF